MPTEVMAEAVRITARPREAGGLRRAHLRPRPRGGRDRRRLHLGRRADPLGQGLRHRPGPHGGLAVMPLLAADIGNSHTVLGLLDDGEVSADWRISTDDRRSADEWAVLLRGLLGDAIDEVDGDRGLLDRAGRPARVARDAAAALPRRHRGRGRARRAHRHPGADGQPARGRLRPDHQRARRGHRVRRPGDRRRLRRHRDHLRRGQRRRASTSAARSRPASRSRSRRWAGAAPSSARSSWPGRAR